MSKKKHSRKTTIKHAIFSEKEEHTGHAEPTKVHEKIKLESKEPSAKEAVVTVPHEKPVEKQKISFNLSANKIIALVIGLVIIFLIVYFIRFYPAEKP